MVIKYKNKITLKYKNKIILNYKVLFETDSNNHGIVEAAS